MTKLQTIITLILFCTTSLLAQTKLEDNITVEIPGNVVQLDTMVGKMLIKNYYSQNETETFSALKLSIESEHSKKIKDIERIKSFINGYNKTMIKNGYNPSDLKGIFIGNYQAFIVEYTDSEKKREVSEALFFTINGYAYSFVYMNFTDFNENNKNNFLSSVKITN